MTASYSIGERVRYRSPRPPYGVQEGIVRNVLSPGYAVRPLIPSLRGDCDAPDDVISFGDIIPPEPAFVVGDKIRSKKSGRSGHVTEVLDGAYVISVQQDNYLTDRKQKEYFLFGSAVISAAHAEQIKAVIAPGMAVLITGNPKNDPYVDKRGITIRKSLAGYWYVAVIGAGEVTISEDRLVLDDQGGSS